MTPASVIGSLVGFALAFWLVTWAISALACGATLVPWRDGGDPAVERVRVTAALIVPPLAGLAVVLAIMGQSIAAIANGVGDHCAPHGHHLHLCVAHGGRWATEPAAVLLVAAAILFVGARLAALAAAHARAARSLAILARSAPGASGDLILVPSPRVFLFAAGLVRRRIYASSAAWNALGADERAAALAHERAHLRGRDVARRLGLSIAAVLGAPLVASRALALWDRSTERLRDRDAAEEVGDGMPVARALIALARAGVEAPAWAAAAPLAPGDDLAGRIEALVGPRPPVERTAGRRLGRFAAAFVVTGSALAIYFADPLHHALETILGVL